MITSVTPAVDRDASDGTCPPSEARLAATLTTSCDGDLRQAAIEQAASRMVIDEPAVVDERPEPVFDQLTFDECVEAVGIERIGGLLQRLSAFIALFRDCLEGLYGSPDAQERSIQEAHKLIPAAGMLGFLELSRLCRMLDATGPGAPGITTQALGLEKASKEAIDHIGKLLAQPFIASGA